MSSRPPRVTVVGGAGVGLVFAVDRSPESGESVLAHQVLVMSGGKAANQAIGAAYLGARTAFVSAVGDDSFRSSALAKLLEYGVDIDAVVVNGDAATMLGAVIVDGQGDNRIVIAPNALAELSAADMDAAADKIASADVCLVGLEIPADAALAALRIAHQHGVRTILNPAPAPEPSIARELLALTDIVTPNSSEAATMTGSSRRSPETYARELVAAGAGTAVVTMGSEGVLIFDGERSLRVEASHVADVVDTSGAGDAFNAALAVALGSGSSLEEACAAGCDAGARIVRGPGFVDALDTWKELRDRYAPSSGDPGD